MVALRDVSSRKPVFYYWGSDPEWDILIYNSLKQGKDTYLWDRTANLLHYPPQLKIIKSQLTARRFLGINLRDAIIFVNAIPLYDVERALKIDWHGGRYFIVRVDRRDLVQIILKGKVDLCCNRRAKYLRMFK